MFILFLFCISRGKNNCQTISVINFYVYPLPRFSVDDAKAEQNTECVNVHVFRSLDLTGPLLLGGVPKLPEDFPVRNRQFVGCMKNLRIDNQHIDMASFIANNGTLPGMF